MGTEPRMRVAVGQINELAEEKLQFAAQLGIPSVQMNTPKLPGETRWEEADLRRLVLKCQEFGLTFEAIENVPIHFYDKAMLGLPGRDEQIENYQATIRNIGRAGIPILGYHFMPNSVWRTDRGAPGRGGYRSTLFDMAKVDLAASTGIRGYQIKTDERPGSLAVMDEESVVTEETMWANYEYFMQAVLPVAEDTGVKLALHPDDPPVEILGGVARLFRNVDGFKRAEEIAAGSPAWGLDLCLGCCSEMPGGAENVMAMIEHFGPRGKIFYIHFRDVQGTVPCFQECFLGEGNYDPAAVLLALKRNGFIGFILDDHVPHIVDDTPWGHRARAHAMGYIQGLMTMMEHVK